MAKRASSATEDHQRPAKRFKPPSDQLSSLSDELLLRIFLCLSIQDLNICQRVSRHFQKIATDSQLWKAAYYDCFIRPRLLRLPGRRRSVVVSSNLSHSSKSSKWLDEGHLVRRGRVVDWKKQYKIRHNWSKGSCDVSQIPVANRPARPPILARLHNGNVYTVDCVAGLRAWSYKDDKTLLASKDLDASINDGRACFPTAFGLDLQDHDPNLQWLSVGQENGAFSIHCYRKSERKFHHYYTHPSSSNGTITAVAISAPYVLCMTDSQLLSLYKFDAWSPDSLETLKPPLLLASLKSQTVWPPISLSMRKAGLHIIASIAYSVPSYLSGWSVGIQELQLSPQGVILSSRTASALAQGFSPLRLESEISSRPQMQHGLEQQSRSYSKPTSLSYSHPYILVSHSDNTLTLYMATSTASDLTVSAGRRLYGHTSSVFSAHVEGRGKAVSVGVQENDIRVWDLEGSTNSGSNRSRPAPEDISVRINPESRRPVSRHLPAVTEAIAQQSFAVGLAAELKSKDRLITRGWVGFDDENLVVLREQHHGAQALAIYSFS